MHNWVGYKWMCYDGDANNPNTNKQGGGSCQGDNGYGLYHITFTPEAVNVPYAGGYLHSWWSGWGQSVTNYVYAIESCDTCPGNDWPLGECWYDPSGSGKLYTLTQYDKP